MELTEALRASKYRAARRKKWDSKNICIIQRGDRYDLRTLSKKKYSLEKDYNLTKNRDYIANDWFPTNFFGFNIEDIDIRENDQLVILNDTDNPGFDTFIPVNVTDIFKQRNRDTLYRGFSVNKDRKKVYIKFKIDVVCNQKKSKNRDVKTHKSIFEEAYEFLPTFRNSNNQSKN